MSKKKKVQAPVYEQLADTAYISGLREDLPTYREGVNTYLQNLDVLSPEVQQKYQDIANDYTQSQWNDFNRSALSNYKAMNQANYNRFGSMGTSGAMYGADSYNRQLNDLASRIASNTAGQYQNLINNYYNQKANTLSAYNTLYGNAGSTLQQNDINNWNIRNRNIEAKYVADTQNAQNKQGFNIGNMISGAASGASMGSAAGPWGAVIGGVAGGALGGFSDYLGGNNAQAGIQGVGSGIQGLNDWSLNTKGKGLFAR